MSERAPSRPAQKPGRSARWLAALRAQARSVRFVIACWHALTLTCILFTFSAVLYVTVANSLSQTMTRSLGLLAQGTEEAIFAFWRAERATEMAPGNWDTAPAPTFPALIESPAFPALIARWEEKTGALWAEHPIRVLSRSGQILAESTAFTGLPVAELPPSDQAYAPTYATIAPKEGPRLRVITSPVRSHESGRVLYAIQVAAPLDQRDATLARLRQWLFWLMPLTLLVTTVVGWYLASWALRPVGVMIRQVEGINAGRLDARIDVPATGDEIERLGATFNALLGRLEDAFRRVRQFSAAASHELRTPLTAMKGELEVTLRRPRPVEAYQDALRAQLEALEDLSLTVQELLALARDDAAQDSIDWHAVDCGGMVRDVVRGWESLAKDRRVRVSVTTEDPAWVLGERHLLERLVMNLLDNALRYTPPGGSIEAAVAQSGGVRLTVTDTGSGIAPEELPFIFDRFFKPRSAPSNGQSTGLGLGLCRWIVEAHRGRLEVVSAPGRGSVFTVWLPAAAPPAMTAWTRARTPGRRVSDVSQTLGERA